MAVSLRFPNRAPASVAKTAAANLVPVRQRTQFTCMASSMGMCLGALGLQDCSEDTVNRVMGAAPMRGAAWEQALATAQHYGVRATLTVPATLSQVKEWTDAGKPVMIGWNPEGREWSHASVIFDVQPCPTHGFMVYVADPNCPDPEQTVRVVPKGEFYAKWYEKFPNYLVRRPALMLEREVTPEGRQVMASMKPVAKRATSVLVDEPLTVPISEVPVSKQAKSPFPVVQKKNPNVVRGEAPAQRNPVVQGLIERGSAGAGKHKNKQDFDRGHARNPKHKGQKGWGAEYMTLPVEEACGAEYMQDHAAKFEQGVSADPTKNMSEADAAEWEKQNAMHRDQFKTASSPAQWPKALEDYVLDNPSLPLGDRWDIVKMSGDEFKVEAVDSVAYLHAKTYYMGEAVVSVIGKTRRGTNFKRQFPVDEKLTRNLIALLNRAKTASGGASLLPSEAARLRAAGLEDACWEGYEAVGMKEQGGKQVPNCVPTKTAARDDSAFVPFPDFWLLPGSVKMKMKQKVEGMGLRFTPHRDGVELHTPLPATPADKRNLAHAVQVLEEGVRNHPAKTAAHRLDGVRGHQLLPATVARKLPAIYSQENVDDPVAQVKLFSPYSGAVWYLTEYDPSSKQAFGWADLGMGGGELGYIDITDLEGLNRRGLPLVERDLYWKPMPLSRAKHSRTASQHFAMFPRGKKMTVDEVAAVVGPEFKDMNENPPETVLAIRRQMEKQGYGKF